LNATAPAAGPDFLFIPVGGAFVPQSGVSLFAARPVLPTMSVVLGVQWPAHEWYSRWADDQSVHVWLLAERLPQAAAPAPAYGPQLNLGYQASPHLTASTVVLPALEVGSPRGPAPANVAAEVPGRPAFLAALVGAEAAVERLSADARRQFAAVMKEAGRALVSAPGRLAPAPGGALADPATSAAPGGAGKDGDTDAGALPPGGATLPGVAGTVVLPPPSRYGTAPATEALEAAPAQLLAGLDLVHLPSRAAALLEGGLPFDLPALTQGVDAFFARLASAGEARDRIPAYARVLPWLAVLSAAAFEFARRRDRQTAAAGDEVLVGPAAFLPHPDEDR
jgi:hypothetical protein